MNRCCHNQKGIFFFLLLLICFRTFGQAGDLELKQSFQDTLFTDFVAHIEEISGYRFFYDPAWIDTITINQPDEIRTLDKLLDYNLDDFNLNYLITKEGYIILSRKNKLKSSLTDDFFSLPEADMSRIPSPQTDLVPESAKKENGHGYNTSELIELGNPSLQYEAGKVTLSGFIKEFETGEPMIGAIAYLEELGIGSATDMNGYYILSLPRGQHQVTYQSLGKEKITLNIRIYSSSSLDIDLKDKLTELKAVEIVADKYQNVSGIQTGIERLEISTIKSVPAMLGEADVVKAALLLPGVQTIGEASTGFHVRGGSSDQNLILFNHAPVYNSSHMFGFFSAFNPDMIKNFELFKSGIPARYGGRVSSVLDITTRQGNMKTTSVNAGISPITGRVSVEGPVIKDKLSYLLGVRTTYSDWILNRINDPEIRNSDATFYDATGKITYKINGKDLLEITGYVSNDYFKLNSDTAYQYRNQNISSSWKHYFSDKFTGELSLLSSSYDFHISSEQNTLSDFMLTYGIRHMELKPDFHYFLNDKHTLRFGMNVISYHMNPNEFRPIGDDSDVEPLILEKERAIESGIYLSDEFNVTPKLKIYGGIRYSTYGYLGPHTVYLYDANEPREKGNVTDSVNYPSGKVISFYHHPELRLSVRYKLNAFNSLKLSYNRNAQYLHMLSNTAIISPTDTWKLSDPHIQPQSGDQVSLGFYKDLPYQIESSVEAYYKRIDNILEYKGGARLINNEQIETDIINGLGKAYGIEFILRKNTGRLNGWLSYTYSRTFVKVDSKFDVEDINDGKYFPSNYDKPHDVSAVCNIVISRRVNFSTNLVYSTGRPITYPVARFPFKNGIRIYYSERNAYRVPDYFRWDMSVNMEGNLKIKKIAHSSWSFSLYNVTGRDNIYSIYFISTGKDIQGYKMSIFTVPVFTVTYNIKF